MSPQSQSKTSTPDSELGAAGAARTVPRDRYQILLDAEVGRLVHELRPFGVMREQTLARQAGCAAWPAGAFYAALRAGARDGQIELLPFGFVGLGHAKQP